MLVSYRIKWNLFQHHVLILAKNESGDKLEDDKLYKGRWNSTRLEKGKLRVKVRNESKYGSLDGRGEREGRRRMNAWA